MKILSAKFTKGIVGGDYSTNDNLLQFAFLGRSNSGKSSVINSLTGQKKLVKASKMPGKTVEANFFKINDQFYLVDFPGYGFALRSIADRNRMIKRIFWYLEFSNVKPRIIFLIIDANVGLTELDREMLEVINKNNHNLIIIANKIDKVAKTKWESKIQEISKEAGNAKVLGYSAKTHQGRDEVLSEIEKLL